MCLDLNVCVRSLALSIDRELMIFATFFATQKSFCLLYFYCLSVDGVTQAVREGPEGNDMVLFPHASISIKIGRITIVDIEFVRWLKKRRCERSLRL